jgi:chorismate dehydratase
VRFSHLAERGMEKTMAQRSAPGTNGKIRIGAVTYLNARPLVFSLPWVSSRFEVIIDLPSRLADALSRGDLDVAMIPSIEYARCSDYSIISDACIACDGPVRSVKLYGRVPVEEIRTLALDEGSRTSAALTRILLKERFGIWPETRPLPIGASADDVPADAVLLIGDRGMLPASEAFEFEWDLGEQWRQWTGLPFVFAMWIARPDVDLTGVAEMLAAARDDGMTRLDVIAHEAAPTIGVSEEECFIYLRDHLEFFLGIRQRQAVDRYFQLAGKNGLAPQDVALRFYDDSNVR